MYKSFYRLDRKPFEIIPDTSFLWLGENYKEALATLRYGILDKKGFLLLTGDSGVGKTSLVKALTKSFDTDVEWGVIDDPSLERIDFYNEIARNFRIDKKFTSKVQFLIQFSHFLHKADDENKKVLLVVDECHLLSQEMLEELRLLSNIEKADAKLINIFFVGQNSFSEMLAQPKNRAVRQRLTLKTEIHPLSVHETEDYIRHRLRVAGARDKIFSAKACQVVHRYSAGVPLRINTLCDAALKAGANQGEATISASLIESALGKIDPAAGPASKSISKDVAVEHARPKRDYSQFKLGDDPDSKITGFNLEAERSGMWLKFGLAALVLVAIGGYFLRSNTAPVVPESTTDQVVEQIEPPRQVPKASSSPAVTVLEENGDGINKAKAEELKSAILEKAYKGEDTAEEVPTTGVVKEDAESPIQAFSDAVTAEVDEFVESPEVHPDSMVEATVGATADEEAAESVVVGDEKVAESISPSAEETVAEVIPVEQVEVTVEPLEPRKILLPLLPNSLKFTRTGRKKFESFVEKLLNYPKATILVKGFVSSKSNSDENIKLSEERALNVYALLLQNGVDPEQIEIEGMGNKEPIASNDTRAGRAKNRRVEIVVIGDGLQ